MMTIGQEEAETVLDGEGLPALVVVPYTGEALVLAEMTAAQLAEAIDDARLFEQSRLRAFKRELQNEVLRRMDGAAAGGQQGAWTIRDGDWKLTGDSPDRSDYNVDELRTVLRSLAEAGLIGERAIGEAIVPSGWKVARRPLAQLTKLGGTVKDAIVSCEQPVTRPRTVTVTRQLR
ncbi:MAG: hypothetical protein ABSG43_22560 [Solirubrobacteraceae bacterium]|jgi:hypothetical protein